MSGRWDQDHSWPAGWESWSSYPSYSWYHKSEEGGPGHPGTYKTDLPLAATSASLTSPHAFHSSTKQYWQTMSSDNRSASSTPTQTAMPVPLQDSTLGMSRGAFAAAIVVPVLFLLSVIALGYFCFRNRMRRNRDAGAPLIAPAAIAEKNGSLRRRHDFPPPPPPPSTAAPVILTSNRNNAYYTGLDTSSFGSRGTSGEYRPRSSDEPPPPYVREPSPPPIDDRVRSPFDDPESPIDIADGMRRPSDPFISPVDDHSAPVSPVQMDDRRGSDVSELYPRYRT